MKLMKKHIRINNVYYSHIFNKNRGLQPRFTVLGGGGSTFSFVLGIFHVERKGTLSISPTIGQASVLSSVDGLPTFYGASNQCRVVKIPWI